MPRIVTLVAKSLELLVTWTFTLVRHHHFFSTGHCVICQCFIFRASLPAGMAGVAEGEVQPVNKVTNTEQPEVGGRKIWDIT